MAVPLAAGALLVAVLFVALRRRWFSRFESGFFVACASAVLVAALLAAALIGTWGYGAARNIMSADLKIALDNVATIVEQDVSLELRRAQERMAGLAKIAAPVLGPRADLHDFTTSLQTVKSFHPHFLEIDLLDAAGRVVVSTEPNVQARVTPDRIGVAFNLEGKPYVSAPTTALGHKQEVLYVGVPVMDGGRVVGAIGTVFDVEAALEEIVHAAKFNESGFVQVLGGKGRVIAHPDEARVGTDLSNHPAYRAAATQSSGELAAVDLNDEERRYFFRHMDSPETVDSRPWLVLAAIDEAEALKPLLELRDELAAGVAALVLVGVLISWGVSRSLNRPMEGLARMAHAVEDGDLTQTSDVHGKDSIARLATALDRMVKGLQERDRVKDVFGRFIAKQAAERLMAGHLDLGGEAKRVTIVFSDIRNFTSMAETMTPEQVVTFLNAYFSEMVDAVMEQGGILDKFLGDGMMAVFGSFGDQPDHARRAVLASLRMKALLAKINGERQMAGKAPIAIGIGIHTATVIVGNIGSKQRLEFTHVGDGVNTASRVQALNKDFHTTILVTGDTLAELGAEFDSRLIDDVTLRGKAHSLPIHEVLSAATGASAVPVEV